MDHAGVARTQAQRRARDEWTREEIRRSLVEAARAATVQSERMDAIDRGEPDPHPEQDAAFADRLVEDLRRKGEL